jgi:hypothetical protein
MRLVGRFGVAVAALTLIPLLPAAAQAETYTFDACITSNYSGCATVAGQITVEVTQTTAGFVDFKFMNTATVESSITALYFDATGFLTSLAIKEESSGVDFKTTNVAPPEVPGSGTWVPQFSVTSGLSTDTISPKAPNGINEAGEFLTLQMGLAAGKTFTDIINALNLGSETDALRIAAHVQGLPKGQSDSIICCTGGGGTPSPEPASISLFGLIALGAAYKLRRREAKTVPATLL